MIVNWVSVKDKMPEALERVFFVASDYTTVGSWTPGTGWLDHATDSFIPDIVTHWMYLPGMPSDE